MSDVHSSVLGQKLEATRTVTAPLPRLNDILSQYAKNVEKGARHYIGCVVESMILDSEIKQFSDVLDGISMPAMIGIIEVQGVDRAALVNIDLDLLYHVVDLRMGGLPTELPEFAARRPTSIDWSMCEPLVKIALEGFCEAVADTFNITENLSMVCTTHEHQPMLANITSDHSDCLFVRMSLDIGEAARSGNFDLIVPLYSLDSIKNKIQKTSSVGQGGSGDAWAEHMTQVVLDTELELSPVLHSSVYSVGQLSDLQVGQVLPLDENSHQQIRVMLDAPGEPIQLTRAKLGAFKGVKALKLSEPPNQVFLNPLREVAEAISVEKES
ncbi:MAG: FliM/FliN family flagellar motor switch protein [Rhodobacteraceae bacterium]|nr:FliM/FliN family flagellar motor switch protein [Paracoccaceae bacterium]